MKKTGFLILLSFAYILFAGNVEVDGNYPELTLYNKNNQKIYTYFLLQPGKNIYLKTSGVETMEIISRVLLSENDKVDYEYLLEIDDKSELIRKNARPSLVTRGISGESVSSYNKVSLSLQNQTKSIRISNKNDFTLLFKFNADLANQSNYNIEYVHFTPQKYGDEEVILIGEKEYTYYTLGEDGIHLKLEGPVVVKIISRYIFDSNFINSNNYRFRIYDNDQLISNYTESAFKSTKSLLVNDATKIPSTGDVNILKLGNGMHNLVIKNGSVNRDMIFRFYISKSSVQINQE